MSSRLLSWAIVLLLGVTVAVTAHAAPVVMSDSTEVEHWTLGNGLKVVTRHIPNAGVVSVTVGYQVGSDDDPANRAGLAQLMGFVGFTAAAGDVPARTREEIDSQRPFGWSYPVSRRSTLFTEVASIEQFPGMLSQIATRMRGVQPTREDLLAGVKTVRTELADQLFGAPNVSLHFQVREVALGHLDEAILRRAGGKDLETLTLKELQTQMARSYVPANGVLAIVGNLSSVSIKPLVENLFGSIPAGVARAESQPGLKPGSRVILRSELAGSVGVVGVLAPALADTLHPSFYLASLLFGTHSAASWAKGAQLSGYFNYALFDEPELVRFYPPLAPDERNIDALGAGVSEVVGELTGVMVTKANYDKLKSQVLWQFGGPLSEDILERVRSDGGLVHQLSRTEAARLMLGGDAFWSEYRRRFEKERAVLIQWAGWFTSPEHQVRLLFAARR